MEIIKLSPRLGTISGFVTPGARVIDVGTDHGLIPVWLLQSGVSPRVIAADIVPGPLSRAREAAREHGLEDKIELILCDGLAGISPQDADEVIIAGMGGDTVAGILERAPWTREKRLILQPMSKPEILREFLFEHGYAIERELFVRDAGKLYVVLAVSGGPEPAPPTQAELRVGRGGEPRELYIENARDCAEKLCRAIRGLERARSTDGENSERLEKMREALGEIDIMLKAYEWGADNGNSV